MADTVLNISRVLLLHHYPTIIQFLQLSYFINRDKDPQSHINPGFKPLLSPGFSNPSLGLNIENTVNKLMLCNIQLNKRYIKNMPRTGN